MQKYCISIDWLQTFNHAKPLTEGTFTYKDYTFTVRHETNETPLFLDVFTIKWKSRKVATVLQRPRNTVIHPRSTCVKLENRILYGQRYIEILYAINNAFSLQYKGITRLDICYDCNRLHGGRDVPRFLRQFMTHEPLKKGHIIRSGSQRFTAHGTRSNTSVANISSMRWGSPNNDISAYCYDKTLEMCEVKRKPWILEMWDKNGLEYDIDKDAIDKLTERERKSKINNGEMKEYVKKSVWRFEISISAKGKDIIDMSTGALFRLSPEYLEHEQQVHELFYIYAGKCFDFRINDGCKKIRDYKPLQLFETEYITTSKPYAVNKSADTGRIEKICFNKLYRLNEQYADLSEPYRNSILQVLQFLQILSGVKFETARLKKESAYLAHLRAEKLISQETETYFRALEHSRENRRELDAITFYDTLIRAPKDKYYQDDRGNIFLRDDLTPPEYIW